MTEPIRLWALRNPRGGISVSDRKGVLVELGEPIELTEVRRCGTCAFFNALCDVCESWGDSTGDDGWCHRHEERLRDKIKTVKEKTP